MCVFFSKRIYGRSFTMESPESVSHTEFITVCRSRLVLFHSVAVSDANGSNQALTVLKYLNSFHELCVTAAAA